MLPRLLSASRANGSARDLTSVQTPVRHRNGSTIGSTGSGRGRAALCWALFAGRRLQNQNED